MRPVRPLTLLTLSALAVALAAALLWLRPGPLSPEPAGAQPPQTVTIAVGDTWFCGSAFQNGVCETAIDAGDKVLWDFGDASLPHTTSECGADCDDPTDTPIWGSGVISDGSSFSFQFDQEGSLLYYCQVHPRQMRGRIVVRGGGPPTPPPPPGLTGDVNCNDEVNAIDAALVLQLNAGLLDTLPP